MGVDLQNGQLGKLSGERANYRRGDGMFATQHADELARLKQLSGFCFQGRHHFFRFPLGIYRGKRVYADARRLTTDFFVIDFHVPRGIDNRRRSTFRSPSVADRFFERNRPDQDFRVFTIGQGGFEPSITGGYTCGYFGFLHNSLFSPILGLCARRRVKQIAHECGFELAGIAPVDPAGDFARYQEWVAQGMAGEMRYLTDRRAEMRRDVRNLLPDARSVICVGKLYNTPDPPREPGDARISRYAWGKDYHVTMRAALERMVVRLLEREPFDWKICVDTAPLLERSFARLAGLGLDRQEYLPDQRASGIVVLSGRDRDVSGARARFAAAGPLRELHALHRGLSNRGVRASKETAGQIDARRCISYLTIELRGSDSR